ncbi:hypothetical protein GPECTOR_15g477 [Gonium pectorale]|uniref:Uncharacterized protein n=1 Tax=Gonium pectorale TaxID=33097 RepID=A0A150GLX6_GONPE|nr:hypothetical protein GPECTOR_15g477 [Gonium pectorale]|eukprot:KXZ50791.1 hypothetical protein GPECTOR_15g477 [Gonium pectorale]
MCGTLRPNVYDKHGRLVVKSLMLPELQRWFEERGGGCGGTESDEPMYGGGLRHLEDAAEPAVGGFSATFLARFG